MIWHCVAQKWYTAALASWDSFYPLALYTLDLSSELMAMATLIRLNMHININHEITVNLNNWFAIILIYFVCVDNLFRFLFMSCFIFFDLLNLTLRYVTLLFSSQSLHLVSMWTSRFWTLPAKRKRQINDYVGKSFLSFTTVTSHCFRVIRAKVFVILSCCFKDRWWASRRYYGSSQKRSIVR